MSKTTPHFSYKTHPPETNFGTVTSWLPLTTPFPLPPGCPSLIWARWGFIVTSNFAAVVFDPGYGITVDSAVSCVPDVVTQWWETEEPSLTAAGATTRFSIGPLVCPEAYTEVGTSVVNSASTQVVCCPLGYNFSSLLAPGIVGECASPISAGAVITYAMMNTPRNTLGGVKFTSTTMASAYYLLGVPINGMLFGVETTSSLSSSKTSLTETSLSSIFSSISSSTSFPATTPNSNAGLSTGAKAGIGVGVGILGLAFILLIVVIAMRKRRVIYAARTDVSHELATRELPSRVYELNEHMQYPELAGSHTARELAG